MVEEGPSGSFSATPAIFFFFFSPFPEFPRRGPFFWEELKAWFSFWLLPMKPVEPVEARADVDPHTGVGTIQSPDLSD